MSDKVVFCFIFQIVNIGETLEFANDFRMQRAPGYPRLTSTVTGSDKTTIYKLKLEHPRAISVHRFLKTTEVSRSDDVRYWIHVVISGTAVCVVYLSFKINRYTVKGGNSAMFMFTALHTAGQLLKE